MLHIALSYQEDNVGAKEAVVDDAGNDGIEDVVGAKDGDDDGRVRVKVPVKRLHSRHRRYIAPGLLLLIMIIVMMLIIAF